MSRWFTSWVDIYKFEASNALLVIKQQQLFVPESTSAPIGLPKMLVNLNGAEVETENPNIVLGLVHGFLKAYQPLISAVEITHLNSKLAEMTVMSRPQFAETDAKQEETTADG